MSLGSELQAFLEMTATVTRSMKRPEGYQLSGCDEAYLRLGEAFPQEDFDREEQLEILRLLRGERDRRHFRPRPQQCFSNAWYYVSVDLFEYADGKAVGSIIPVDHAWNVFRGKVLDFTWRADSDRAHWSPEKLLTRARRNIERSAYWGITVPLKELYRQRVAVGHRLYVEEPPDYPVLKTGALPWEVEPA